MFLIILLNFFYFLTFKIKILTKLPIFLYVNQLFDVQNEYYTKASHNVVVW